MKRVILTLMVSIGFAHAGQGYWDCTKSHGRCNYMKYNEEAKAFTKANHLPTSERVYSLSPVAQHNATQINYLAFNVEK